MDSLLTPSPSDLPAHQRILLAAAQVFSEQGYKGATTRMIARRAGVNEVTIFRQFGSKQQLLASAVAQAATLTGLEAALSEGRPADLRQELTRLSRRYLERLTAQRGLLLMTLSSAERLPEARQALRSGIPTPTERPGCLPAPETGPGFRPRAGPGAGFTLPARPAPGSRVDPGAVCRASQPRSLGSHCLSSHRLLPAGNRRQERFRSAGAPAQFRVVMSMKCIWTFAIHRGITGNRGIRRALPTLYPYFRTILPLPSSIQVRPGYQSEGLRWIG